MLLRSRSQRRRPLSDTPVRSAAVLQLVAAALVCPALAAQPPGGPQGGAPTATRADSAAARVVTALADRYVTAFAAAFPEVAEWSGMPLARHDGLSDNSLAAVRAWQATEDSLATALDAVDGAALRGQPAWTTYGFLREALDASRASRVCRSELWPVNQMSGWQANFAVLAEQQPVGSAAHRADALARWGQLPRYLEVETRNLREGARLGYTAPKRLVQLVIGQLDELVAAAPEASPLYGPAARDSTPAFRAAWRRLLVREVTPAARRYRDFLRDEYLPAARSALAVSANPDGSACYRASFRAQTSLDRAPEETLRLGEAVVARSEDEVRAMGRRLFGTGELDSIHARVRDDPRNHFRSRAELLAFSRAAVARARQASLRWFTRVPRSDVVVEPYPAFLEQSAATPSYEMGAEDGSRPATFRITLFAPETQLRGRAEVQALHETFPGHHLQIGLAQERPTAHALTRLLGSGAFVEGWGRYAEVLGEEMGLYTSDFARIGRRAWPGHGMVVDPGLHVFGWTRERAVRYVAATGVWSPAAAEALVDRAIAWPGQLTSYDTGALELFALRERAERALGPAFDVRRFHDAVLGEGAVTLPMLRQQVDDWIAREQRTSAASDARRRRGP